MLQPSPLFTTCRVNPPDLSNKR